MRNPTSGFHTHLHKHSYTTHIYTALRTYTDTINDENHMPSSGARHLPYTKLARFRMTKLLEMLMSQHIDIIHKHLHMCY